MSRVLIVGAGPAGASLAYLLAQRGIQVTLLERRRDFAREFRGEILMPSGISALEQMGLGDQLIGLPGHTMQEIGVYLNGRPILDQTLEATQPDGLAIRAVSQPALLEMLTGEAGRSSSFELIRGASVRELTRENGRVTGVRIRVDEEERVLPADLVVGADGRHSAVRREVGIAAGHVSPPMDVVWCKLPRPADWNGVRAYAGRGHLLFAYRTWDDSLQLGWVILKGTFGELKSRGIEQWVAEMAGHVSPDLAAHLRAHQDAVSRPFLLESVSDCVERWSSPGILLIGDAAHTMSPVGGQGINIALRDTIVAANHLVPVLCAPELDSAGLQSALLAIEAERMPEIRQIQSLQAQPPKVLLTRAWWGEPVRQLVGALIRRPAFRARAGDTAEVFFNGVTQVELAV